MNEVSEFGELGVGLAMEYGPPLGFAIITLVIGLWLINAVTAALVRAFERRGIDETLRKFFRNLINFGLKALLLISVASMVGIETTSFIAVLGAAGLAVGLALQGSLANFAGGVLILMFRPYKAGDFIDTNGHAGSVREIGIFNTIMTTPDNKTVIIPNGAISNSTLTNFSTQPTRRVDLEFDIGYGDDLKRAKDVLRDLIESDARVLKDPEPVIVVSSLGDSSVNIATRSWVNAADYFPLLWDLTEKGKLAFDEAGISIPFPQRDVHLYQKS